MSCSLKGYDVCRNQDEVVAEIGYDSESDLENPTGSVFCTHGAGFIVPWYQVEEYMHLESSGRTESEVQAAEIEVRRAASRIELTQEELDAIYIRTPDPLSRSRGPVTVRAAAGEADEGMDMPAVSKGEARGKWASYKKEKEKQEEYLLVD